MISSYTFGIYPRSEELIEATRKNTENLPSIVQKETGKYINAQKNANLGFVSDPLLKWDDIYRPFSNLASVNLSSLNRIYEMNTFYRVLSFDGSNFINGSNTVQSNLDSSLPKNKTAAVPEPFTFADRHISKEFKTREDFTINLAKMLRAEIDSLVSVGFEIIQLLAPSIAYNKEVDFGLISDGLKILTDGLEAKLFCTRILEMFQQRLKVFWICLFLVWDLT